MVQVDVQRAFIPDLANESGDSLLPRILFISRDYASDFGPKVGGMFQRMRMLLEAAARATNALEILFFVDQSIIDRIGPEVAQASLKRHWNIDAAVTLAPRASKRYGAFTQTLRGFLDFRSQDAYFRVNDVEQRSAVRAQIAPDTALVIAHRLAIGAVTTVAARSVPVVMDLDDIEHRKLVRQLRQLPFTFQTILRWSDLPALRYGETKTVRSTRTSLVCSQGDRDYLKALGAVNVSVIPNAIRFPVLPPEPVTADERVLFFIGTYAYQPNLDAAEYLINIIFPLVLQQLPETRLLLAGEMIDRLPSLAQAPSQVEFAGFVPDLAAVYRRVTVVCCPIWVGGGTRIKIIEAAAAAKAVVATTIGAEGIDLDDETEILRRDTPQAFADACIALLIDSERRLAIGEAAFAKARALYDRGPTIEKLVEVFVNAAP